MLTHVVLFRFANLTLANDARDRLLALRGRIPTLQNIEAGVDITRSSRSFDLALITRFEDAAGLKAYDEHPLHVEVVEWIRTVVTQMAAVDFQD
jgi:hypothetical protein